MEGMELSVLRQALERAGATIQDGGAPSPQREPLTKGDFYELGLTGARTAPPGGRRCKNAWACRRGSLPMGCCRR